MLGVLLIYRKLRPLRKSRGKAGGGWERAARETIPSAMLFLEPWNLYVLYQFSQNILQNSADFHSVVHMKSSLVPKIYSDGSYRDFA